MATADKLSAPAGKNARAAEKPYKMTGGSGLYLLVNPDGSKYWRMAYRFADKQKTLALGVYPDVTLSVARNKRYEARKLLTNDVDPAMLKQVTKRATRVSAENSFEAVAREWYAKFSGEWVPSHGEKIIRRLERDLFSWIGKRPIAEITAPELLAALRRIESRRALDTAHRAHQNCGQVSAMQLPPDALNAILASHSTWLIWSLRHKHESCQILPNQLTLSHEHNEHIPTRHAQVLRG